MSLANNYFSIKNSIPKDVTLVVVSKMRTIESIKEIYDLGQRDFGENKVQELLLKQKELPKDIRWHLIGHLQSKKVKQIISKVSLIQSVDSLKLIEEIQKEAFKINLKINILLQPKIAEEESKYGLTIEELEQILLLYKEGKFPNIILKGFMGMATFTQSESQIENEFKKLKFIAIQNPEFPILSMGMSSDFELAINCGSNLVRIGSSIFKQ